MKNKNSKTAIIISILCEIFLIISSIFKVILKNELRIKSIILLMVAITIPFIITKICNKKKIQLPSSFQLILIIFILLTLYLGEIKRFYDIFWWWDLFAHSIFGWYGVIIGLNLIKGIIKKDIDVTTNRFKLLTLIFSVNFTITLGVLWEVFEFLGDYFFKTAMVKGGLNDTMTDIIVKISAALIVAIIIYLKDRNKEKSYN